MPDILILILKYREDNMVWWITKFKEWYSKMIKKWWFKMIIVCLLVMAGCIVQHIFGWIH